jgi:hypothetical protein
MADTSGQAQKLMQSLQNSLFRVEVVELINMAAQLQ